VAFVTIGHFAADAGARVDLTSLCRHAIHAVGSGAPAGWEEASMKPWATPGAILAAAWLALTPYPGLAGPPEQPRVIEGIEIGNPGGELRMLIGRQR